MRLSREAVSSDATPYSTVRPLPPSVCTARSAAFQTASAEADFAMFAASPYPMSSPASYSAAAFWVISRASSTSTWDSASGCAIAWWAPIGVLKTWRVLA